MTALPNPRLLSAAFRTRAEAAASRIAPGVDVILVGDNAYRRDNTGTALTTLGSVNWSPLGEITFQHFADNTTPGATAFNEAIGRMLTWLRANQNNDDFTPGPIRRVSGMGEKIALTGPVYTAGLKCVEFVDTDFVAVGGAWPVWGGSTDFFGNRVHAPAMWNLNTGTGMTRPQTVDVSFVSCTFNAAGLAAGFVNANDTRGQCGVLNCHGYRPTDYGVHLQAGQNSDFRIFGNRFRQFEFSDAERLDANNLTATLVDVRSPDAKVNGNTLFYCGLPIYLGAYSDFVGNHVFQGVSGVSNLPADLLPLMVVESPGGLVCDNYMDTGHVIFRVRSDAVATGHQVMFERNRFFLLEGAHSFVAKVITDQVDTTLAGFTFKNNTIRRVVPATLTTEAVLGTEGSGTYVATDRLRHVSKDNHRSDTVRGIWRGLPDREPIPFWAENAATDTVEGLYAIKMQNPAATTVTNATGGVTGQTLSVICINNLTTFAHNTGGAGRFLLQGGVNITPAAGRIVVFVSDGLNWRHLATTA